MEEKGESEGPGSCSLPWGLLPKADLPEESEWTDSRERIYWLCLQLSGFHPRHPINKVPQALPGVIYECRAKSHEH